MNVMRNLFTIVNSTVMHQICSISKSPTRNRTNPVDYVQKSRRLKEVAHHKMSPVASKKFIWLINGDLSSN
jgi:uncharacterized protein YcgL (UPF0745 family)